MAFEKPSEIEEEGIPWVFATGVSGEEYCRNHNVTLPQEMDQSSLPDTEFDKVGELDKEALDKEKLTGKWNIFVGESEVDDVWHCVCEGVNEGDFWRAKASTKWARQLEEREEHVVIVYSPNYLDKGDVERVRELIRDNCGIDETLYYKPDIYTAKGIYRETANEMGLPGASRYSG